MTLNGITVTNKSKMIMNSIIIDNQIVSSKVNFNLQIRIHVNDLPSR